MDEFYSVYQAAIALKVHPLTIRRYIKQKKLKAYRAGGNIRIAVNDLRSFLQNFIPKQVETPSSELKRSTNEAFSFSDPLFSLKGKVRE